MDRQEDKQTDTKVFIPVTTMPTAHRPLFRCLVASVNVMILVVVFVGLCFYIRAYRELDKQFVTEKVNQNFNQTFTLQKSIKEGNIEKYVIFTVQEDGKYFLHGQVRRAHGTGTVWLFWDRPSQNSFHSNEIQVYRGSCHPEIIFAKEMQFLKKSRVFLVFNEGQPDLVNSNFTIYRLCQQ